MESLRAFAQAQMAEPPTAQLLWTAAVTVAPREDLGTGPGGERFIIPITGGLFWGGPGHEALRGQVVAGGADRQLWRPDGIEGPHAWLNRRRLVGTLQTLRPAHEAVLIRVWALA
ncbi:MAG: hypothetical protein CFE45_35410 [Burkholderiales bacterium PBB5]|nr:MAG: hypothetical protein CFE45_35410 [Burkholderiales bacterium PBB5]